MFEVIIIMFADNAPILIFCMSFDTHLGINEHMLLENIVNATTTLLSVNVRAYNPMKTGNSIFKDFKLYLSLKYIVINLISVIITLIMPALESNSIIVIKFSDELSKLHKIILLFSLNFKPAKKSTNCANNETIFATTTIISPNKIKWDLNHSYLYCSTLIGTDLISTKFCDFYKCTPPIILIACPIFLGG